MEENKRAAKSLETFHCKTSFKQRKKRGREREREHVSLSLSLFRGWRRRRRGDETHTTGNGFRKLRKRTTTTRGKLEQTLFADGRESGSDGEKRSEETEKGGTPTTNTYKRTEKRREDAMEEPDAGS